MRATRNNLRAQLADAQEAIRVLQNELAETNKGLVALTLELEHRVDERTVQLRTAHEELQRTNSELLQLTLELEERVTQRTEEIRKLNEELEERVGQRTAQLEAANAELEAFTYSVSHDLRAPLRAIDGFGQAVLEEYAHQLDAQGQDFLRRVRAATQRMAELIDGLLTLSHVTRAELRREPVGLTDLAQAVAAELRKAEPARQMEFVIPPGLTAEGDPRLVRVVVTNLLGNAWKFTAGRADSRIEMGSLNHAGDVAVFFVRDNGVGFDMSYADKLFAPFQRLHRQSEFPGTGIGLATVQRIVRRHGGRVWAEAAVGQGATFYFSLSAQTPA